MVTSRIALGTFVASPNFRHPVSFARQLTALDDISNGRMLLGLGAGAGGASFDARVLGEPDLTPRQRVDRYGEFAELLDLLLRTDHVTWTGRYYRALDARNLPGCVQQPRIPFVMAANGKRSIGLAARLGDGWVTTGSATDDVAASRVRSRGTCPWTLPASTHCRELPTWRMRSAGPGNSASPMSSRTGRGQTALTPETSPCWRRWPPAC